MWLPSALSLSSQTRQTLCEAPHRPRARATPEHKRDPSGRGPARLQCTAPWTPCGTDLACPGGAGGSPQPQAASGPFRPQPGVPMSVLRPHLRLPKRTAAPGISERRAAARARPLPQPRRTRSPQTAGRSGSVSETQCVLVTIEHVRSSSRQRGGDALRPEKQAGCRDSAEAIGATFPLWPGSPDRGRLLCLAGGVPNAPCPPSGRSRRHPRPHA